jgi:hypothetical protein
MRLAFVLRLSRQTPCVRRTSGHRRAVLKLDTEGDGAARRAKFLKLSTCEERRQFLFLERG